MECVASTVQEAQGYKVESLIVQWVSVKQFTYRNCHVHSRESFGIRPADRAEIYGLVKRHEAVQAILPEVEPGPCAEKGPI